jgi:hypothetical protein
MPERRAIILAAGKEWRFTSPREMLEFDGIPLILRTVKQLEARGVWPWIASRTPDRYAAINLRSRVFVPAKCRWQTQTMLSTRELWARDQTLILNGDVYYSERCMDLLVEGKTMFYCGEAEIWGMSIASRWYERAEKAARYVVRFHDKHPNIDENLWRFYRRWYGQNYVGQVDRTPGLAFQVAGTVIMVFDETVDFDFPREYDRWQSGLRGREVKAPSRGPLCTGRTVVEFPGTDRWRCPITGKTYRGFAHCEPKGCRHHVPQVYKEV